MRQRSHQRSTRRTTDDHFTGVRIRKLDRKVVRRRGFPSAPLISESMDLAVHLSQQCGACWRGVDQVAGRLRPSLYEPVTSAISRIASPKAWITMNENQRYVLRSVRERPYGFAYAVLEEAASQVVAQALKEDGPPPDPEDFLFWANRLLGELENATPGTAPPELFDVSTYKLCRLAEIHLFASKVDAVQECLDRIEELQPSTTGAARLKVEVLEIEAHLHQLKGQWRKADRCYGEALEVVGRGEALRRFELRAGATEMLLRSRVTKRSLATFSAALGELSTELSDPIERVAAVHTLARATWKFAQMAYCAGLRRWPGILESIQALDEARPLYRKYVDRHDQLTAARMRADLQALAPELTPADTN